MRKKKLVYGIAINDAKEPVVKKIKENGVCKDGNAFKALIGGGFW